MDDLKKRIVAYQLAMSIARSMRSQGLISEGEYHKIDTTMRQKYGLSSCTIFA